MFMQEPCLRGRPRGSGFWRLSAEKRGECAYTAKHARDFKAGDINAGDLKAGDFIAGDYIAGDINAGYLNAGDFNAVHGGRGERLFKPALTPVQRDMYMLVTLVL